MRLALPLLLTSLLLAAGCSPATPLPAASAEAAVTRSGEGIANSAPFTLAGGDYRATWTARPPGRAGCSHALDLAAADDAWSEVIASVMIEGALAKSGEGFLPRVRPGRYYIRASSGCRWEVTLSPASS